MKNWLKEPLVHFVILGAALFIGHAIWAKHVARSDYEIEISQAEIARQLKIFSMENNRQPTEEDLVALKYAFFEEQVLMREALRLGLDEDDTIIRRRLAQKMRFMIQDSAPPPLPSEEVLQDWYDENKDRFAQPAQRSFNHVYISPNAHDDIDQEAARIGTILNDDNWQSLGDPFIERSEYGFIDKPGAARRFGENFANRIFELEQGQWVGPVESAFGLHYVKIRGILDREVPTFEEAKIQVGEGWQDDQTRAENLKSLEALLSKYEAVDID